MNTENKVTETETNDTAEAPKGRGIGGIILGIFSNCLKITVPLILIAPPVFLSVWYLNGLSEITSTPNEGAGMGLFVSIILLLQTSVLAFALNLVGVIVHAFTRPGKAKKRGYILHGCYALFSILSTGIFLLIVLIGTKLITHLVSGG